jgi:hypothetical protein
MSDIHDPADAQSTQSPSDEAARLASGIIRTILATGSDDDPKQRAGVARALIGMARANGTLKGRFGAGISCFRASDQDEWFAALCLDCGWVGDIGDAIPALAQVRGHLCQEPPVA